MNISGNGCGLRDSGIHRSAEDSGIDGDSVSVRGMTGCCVTLR